MNIEYGGGFEGFPRECMAFLRELAEHNETSWFNRHREEYDLFVLDPLRRFVVDMGGLLVKIAPRIVADPKVNRSLFRIHRDIRFSKDKRPFKTHVAAWFWEGDGPRMERSGFYFHLEPDRFMLGAGVYCFTKPQLEDYRNAVADTKRGAALKRAVGKVLSKGYQLGGEQFKRVPRGFDKDHPNADLLLYGGLYAGMESGIPDVMYSRDILDFCVRKYADMTPLHEWLLELLG